MRLRHFHLLWILSIGLLSGCVEPLSTSPDQTSVADLSAFYWSPDALSTGVRYAIQGDTSEQHTLTSSDGIHITDVSGYSTGALVIRATRDSIVVDSISTHTIFLLPPGFALSPAPTPLAVKAVLELPPRRLIAATPTGLYYTDDRVRWTQASGLTGPVAVLGYDSVLAIAYATIGDSVFQSGDGAEWVSAGRPRKGHPISALAINALGTVYVGYRDSSVDRGSFGYGFSEFVRTGREVRSIAVSDSAGRHIVGIATDESITLFDDTTKLIMSSPAYNTESVTAVDHSEMIGVQGGTLTRFYVSARQPITLSGMASEALTVAVRHQSWYYAGGVGGRLFRYTGSLTEAANLSSRINAMLISRSGDLVLATDAGLWSFNGSAATKISGPYADDPRSGAPGLVLLNRMNGALTIGSSWGAGNLYISAVRTSVPITARVIDHVDTLLTPVGSRFGETYVVRYAFENGGQIDPTLPVYWLVYYSRGAGPTIIEEYFANVPPQYLIKSRASMVR